MGTLHWRLARLTQEHIVTKFVAFYQYCNLHEKYPQMGITINRYTPSIEYLIKGIDPSLICSDLFYPEIYNYAALSFLANY